MGLDLIVEEPMWGLPDLVLRNCFTVCRIILTLDDLDLVLSVKYVEINVLIMSLEARAIAWQPQPVGHCYYIVTPTVAMGSLMTTKQCFARNACVGRTVGESVGLS